MGNSEIGQSKEEGNLTNAGPWAGREQGYQWKTFIGSQLVAAKALGGGSSSRGQDLGPIRKGAVI